MSPDNYITESELEEVQKQSCGKIDIYRGVRRRVKLWHKEFGLMYPHTSENNYRDCWFHYRKLYKEHSTYEVINQMATFDEHIQRAEKDSVIYFYQKISEMLEFWYFMYWCKHKYEEDDAVNEALLVFDGTADKPNTWVLELKRKYEKDIDSFIKCCVCVACKRILTDEFSSEVQKLLHEIKNNVLKIRVGGAKIHRIEKPGEYMEQFEQCHSHIVSFSNKYRIKELLTVSDFISDSL